MKKTLLLFLTCVVVCSLCGITAAADTVPEYIGFTAGYYVGADGESFSPVGDVTIMWAPEVAAKVDLTDGDISDWAALDYTPVTITENQMVSWVGGENGTRDPGMPREWGIIAYFVADADYLYMAFDITDSDFTYGDTTGYYNGDALQLSVDFGGRLGDMIQNNPDDICCLKNIFYSFSCEGDGAPIRVMRQETDNDGIISEANGDGVKGATRRTETGWSAEIALSWDQLYDDYSWKSWDDKKIYIGGFMERALQVGLTAYYLNRTEPAGAITWAAGTTTGITVDDGIPLLSWTAYDNGIQLKVPYEKGMGFNCDGIAIIYWDPALPDEVATEIATEIATEPAPEPEPPEPDDPPEETAYSVEFATEYSMETVAETLNPEIEAVLEKYSCSMTAGLPVAFLGILAAAAAVLRKKD